MAVYVDCERMPYGRMTMRHMLADTEEELRTMAAKIGVALRWHQLPGSPKSHFDICLSKRAKAIELGAIEIDRGRLVEIVRGKRAAAQAAAAAGPT